MTLHKPFPLFPMVSVARSVGGPCCPECGSTLDATGECPECEYDASLDPHRPATSLYGCPPPAPVPGS